MTVSDTRRTLDLSLANQIVSVVTAERSAEINRSGLRVALEQLELSKRKEALGAATALDVVRAKQNAANARAALVNGDEALREAREALGLDARDPGGDRRGSRHERQRDRRRRDRRLPSGPHGRRETGHRRRAEEPRGREAQPAKHLVLVHPGPHGNELAQRDDGGQPRLPEPDLEHRRGALRPALGRRHARGPDQEPGGRRGHRLASARDASAPGDHPGAAGAARHRGCRGLVQGRQASSETSRRRTTR